MNTFVDKVFRTSIFEIMWTEYQRIKDLEIRSEIEDEFRSRFWSWDKSGCSPTGLVAILCWYVASIENNDPYRNDEYKALVDFLNEYSV